jgi:hypothetical protein
MAWTTKYDDDDEVMVNKSGDAVVKANTSGGVAVRGGDAVVKANTSGGVAVRGAEEASTSGDAVNGDDDDVVDMEGGGGAAAMDKQDQKTASHASLLPRPFSPPFPLHPQATEC